MDRNITTLTGYLSVSAAIKGKQREIICFYVEPERLTKCRRSDFKKMEKAQYAEIFDYSKKFNVPVLFKPQSFFDQFNSTCGGIAADVSDRKFYTLDTVPKKSSPFYVYLEGIEDPFNFGYTLRALFLAGCDGVFLPERNYFSSSDIVCRASAGASELLDITTVSDLEAMCMFIKQQGITIVCTSSDVKVPTVTDSVLKKPILLVVGGEKRGISRAILEKADKLIRIDYATSSKIALPASSAACLLSFKIFEANR